MGNISYCCSGPDGGLAKPNEVVVGEKNVASIPNVDPKKLIYEERTYQVGTYKGQMLNGQRCGYGVCIYNSGPSYKGQWYNDKCHGDGIFTDSDSTYSGQWRSGKKHGWGEEVWQDDGTRYVGEHVQGNKHGKGQYIWKDGSCYDGSFENDVVSGYGMLKDADGGVYTGQFQDNMQHGTGKYMFKNTTYEGQWEETLKHGKGILKDGKTIYEGQFLDNVQHGTGMETDLATGKKIEVKYKNGKKV